MIRFFVSAMALRRAFQTVLGIASVAASAAPTAASLRPSGVAKCAGFVRLNASSFSEDEFRRRFRNNEGKPVILQGLSVLGRGTGVSEVDAAAAGGFGAGGAAAWTREALVRRLGHLMVESQHVMVHRRSEDGRLGSTGLVEATTLDALIGFGDATLVLLRPGHVAVQTLTEDLAVPDALRPIQQVGPTISVGGWNASSPFHQHKENWFAHVHGQKAWVVGPADGQQIAKTIQGAHPCDLWRLKANKLPKGMRRCALQAGEVLYLPPQWHHGTCNLADFVIGVGFFGSLDHLPPLHMAAALGRVDDVAKLVRSPSDTAARDGEAFQPLHWAANRGHVAVVQQLLKLGSDPEVQNGNGGWPVHLAAFEGHLGTVKDLLRASKGCLHASTHAGARPLHLAASRGHAAVVKLLLQRRAAAGQRDSNGAEPLHMAAYEGHMAVAELLLARGASARATSNDGTEPARLARSRHHYALATRLQSGAPSSAGGDVDAAIPTSSQSKSRRARRRRASSKRQHEGSEL
eukprot:TRINITY_DN34113_c0_g1_i1.p1 TRINITY_DN34113_c0_g1~~TRINITY_DN34113_c0_g1_i1.p1  ORF type:complete len:519 (+),score=75.70 TRINITY_DN34113_c0_g1_i1:76-1632(+)